MRAHIEMQTQQVKAVLNMSFIPIESVLLIWLKKVAMVISRPLSVKIILLTCYILRQTTELRK